MIMCEESSADVDFSNIERCPWPSKRVEKPNKYWTAWEKFKGCAYKYEDYTFEDFEFACREAGLV